jgi:hypothetical protein
MVTDNPRAAGRAGQRQQRNVLAGARYDATRGAANFCAALQTIIRVADARDVAE